MFGVYKDLSNEEYHADRSAISRSGLWSFKKAPQKYWNEYLNPERPEKKQTDDMIFGSAFHTFVLEPHLFEQQYCIKDVELPVVDEKPLKRDLQALYGKDKGAEMYEEAKALEERQKAARDKALAEFTAKSANRILLTNKDMDKLIQMRASVLKHQDASRLIVDAAIEHSLFWEDPHTGIKCKTRPDIWHSNMTVDLKTTKDADERSFRNSLLSLGYHLQSAMNREGIFHTGHNDIKTHTFLCVEKEWPHLVAVYILNENALDSAHNLFKNTLTEFKRCKENDVWAGYETKEIDLPAWA